MPHVTDIVQGRPPQLVAQPGRERPLWAAGQERAPGDQRAVAPDLPLLRFTVARFNDNELVLFDAAARESWIVYPPRSAYDFLPLRRSKASITLVEHHPWAPMSVPVDHEVEARSACLTHGTVCAANQAIEAAVAFGFDPFG